MSILRKLNSQHYLCKYQQNVIISATFAEIMLVFLRKVCFDSADKGGVAYVYLRMQKLA